MAHAVAIAKLSLMIHATRPRARYAAHECRQLDEVTLTSQHWGKKTLPWKESLSFVSSIAVMFYILMDSVNVSFIIILCLVLIIGIQLTRMLSSTHPYSCGVAPLPQTLHSQVRLHCRIDQC